MVSLLLFVISVVATLVHYYVKKKRFTPKLAEVFLSYVLLFMIGVMGLLTAYALLLMENKVVVQIGWPRGSPFAFQMAMTNLSYGILGILSYWIRGRFWDAVIIGWSIFLVGCFAVHVSDYYEFANNAPLNIGVSLWFYDLFSPLIALPTLIYIRTKGKLFGNSFIGASE